MQRGVRGHMAADVHRQWDDADRRPWCDRATRDHHPRRRLNAGDVQGIAALLLPQRQQARRHEGQLHRLEPGQALADTYCTVALSSNWATTEELGSSSRKMKA